MAELWELYDEEKRPTGLTMYRGDLPPAGYRHIVVDIWTLTSDGFLLLTQRHPDKHWPLFWEGTGGSVLAGENSLEGALRELKEETGLIADRTHVRLLSSEKAEGYFFDNYLYLCPEKNPILVLQPEEVVDACFVDVRDIDDWKERIAPPAWSRLERDREAIIHAAEQCRTCDKYLGTAKAGDANDGKII